MTYRNVVKQQIIELEEKLARIDDETVLRKTSIKSQLEKLRAIEFEEDIRESDDRRLLLG